MIFFMKEMVNPRKVRLAGKFVLRLNEQLCDCGKFQKLHYLCSHVLVKCKHVHHDFDQYINHLYSLDEVNKVYYNLFR
ncbi:hypothetical protein PHAVU_005G052300, partial [Phaseolus vulgaris]